MLESWPYNKRNFATKHGKLDGLLGWFPLFLSKFLRLQHRSELDHTSSESEIRHLAPPWEDHWQDRPATYFFNLGSRWSSLPNLFEARNWNYVKNSKEQKGIIHKNVINILEGKQSWRFTTVVQQLATPRCRASGEVGPWFLPLSYCGCGEDLLNKNPFACSCDLYIIHAFQLQHHGVHNLIPNITATLTLTLAHDIWC